MINFNKNIAYDDPRHGQLVLNALTGFWWLQGMLSMSAWGRISNAHHLNISNLSFLSGLLEDIKHALDSQADSVTLSHVEVPLDHFLGLQDKHTLQFALFVGLPAPSTMAALPPVHRSELSEFLRASTRVVSVRPANFGIIFEAAFR
jgi:hypothetical protein